MLTDGDDKMLCDAIGERVTCEVSVMIELDEPDILADIDCSDDSVLV